MILYNVGSLLKIILGTIITYYIYNYINIYQDPTIGLIFGFIGIFLIVWGTSFYLYYIYNRIFSTKGNLYIASKSYKLSLMTGLYIVINVALIVMETWTKLIGLGLLVVFVLLQVFIAKDSSIYK